VRVALVRDKESAAAASEEAVDRKDPAAVAVDPAAEAFPAAADHKDQVVVDFDPTADTALAGGIAEAALVERYIRDRFLPNSGTVAAVVVQGAKGSDWDTAAAADSAGRGCLAGVDSRGCWGLSFQDSYTLLFLTVVGPSYGNCSSGT
jgi:hypothetical protein